MNETMTVTPLKTILLSLVSSFGFTACSTFSTQTVFPSKPIEQVQNIDALPDTKTNAATLNQYKDHCVIKFTGYFEGGESTEIWDFKANKLSRAFSETYQYDLKSAINGTTQKHALDPKTRTVTVFDIQSNEIKNNFEKLKSHFSQNALAQCS